jgi:hypothetical protein
MTDRALMTLPVSMPQQYALMEMTKFEYRAMIIERLQSLKAQIEAPDQDHGPDTMKIVTEDIRQRTVPRGVWGWTRLALVALGGLVVLNVSGRILHGPLQFAFPSPSWSSGSRWSFPDSNRSARSDQRMTMTRSTHERICTRMKELMNSAKPRADSDYFTPRRSKRDLMSSRRSCSSR